MQTKILSCNTPRALESAAKILAQGGLVAFPTDTIYGIAAAVDNIAGIQRLFAVKERSEQKAIAVLIGEMAQLSQVASNINPQAQTLARAFWPGALTLVMERHPSLPEILSPTPTIGVRMPALPFALELLKKCGPLATTSANLSGKANPVTAQNVIEQLGTRFELLLDGGNTPGPTASTVVDCTRPGLPILRHGVISQNELQNVLDKLPR